MAHPHKELRNAHLRIVVSEGKVTLEELHAALDKAVAAIVHGGCNCGLTGFDVSFVRGDPAFASLAEVGKVANVQGAVLTEREIAG